MLFIRHYSDSEREEKPPQRIRHIATRTCETGNVILSGGTQFYMNARNTQMDRVMATPDDCGPDYWEIVVEATDL